MKLLNALEFVKKFKLESDTIECKSALGGFPKKCYDTISSFSG